MHIPDSLPYCIYVLISEKDSNFYVGFTTDLQRRFKEHQQGRNRSTASRRPFKLIHAEMYAIKAEAMRRENHLKPAKGRRALRLMLKDALSPCKPA